MGKVDGFLEIQRYVPGYEEVEKRLKHWGEFEKKLDDEGLRQQGARCMDCGVPFCHTGCPLGNIIPDWNDLVYRDRWQEASHWLHSTNNFPEFTGRVCPAPCEAACVLNINDDAVTIKKIEKSIADRALEEGWVVPQPPRVRTGKKVAVIGSGPAGLAAAQQLARVGHSVTVFEKADRIGGLLRYGIPDFKMDKLLIDFRSEQMEAEGVTFRTNVHAGKDLPADRLLAEFDAVCLAGGAEQARELPIPGRELKGIHLAMDFLPQQNRRVAGDTIDPAVSITAKDKTVVILGGGDTGSDCLGTSHRQGAKMVYNFELLPKPPPSPAAHTPWPNWPLMLRTSHAHEEGGVRDWSVLTKSFSGDERGNVEKLHAVRVRIGPPDASGRAGLEEMPGSEFTLDCDLVLLAMGFVGPVKEGLLNDLGVKLDARGNVATDDNYMTSVPGVFAAGDLRRGQSLVVWAISEGRQAARCIDRYLMGWTVLE
jgi:glutamate synthase (NADPH/NADH) small chain